MARIRDVVKRYLDRERQINELSRKYGIDRETAREIHGAIEAGVISRREAERMLREYRRRQIEEILAGTKAQHTQHRSRNMRPRASGRRKRGMDPEEFMRRMLGM